MEKKCLLPLLAVILALMAGCGAPPKQTPVGMGEMPNWVAQPRTDKGIAAAECVPASDEFSTDRKKALGFARQSLAKQLRNRVQAMDRAYRQRIAEEDAALDGAPFGSAAPQLIRETLKETEPHRMSYEKFHNQKHFCAALLLGKKKLRRFFQALVQRSETEISPRDREMLYKAFRTGGSQGS